jgi:hypothetical protein
MQLLVPIAKGSDEFYRIRIFKVAGPGEQVKFHYGSIDGDLIHSLLRHRFIWTSVSGDIGICPTQVLIARTRRRRG